MPAVIENIDGLNFMKGFLYMTRDGGAADAVDFAALQDISINYAAEFTEIRGPEKLSPLGVGVTGEQLSGSASSAVLKTEQLIGLIGGSDSYSAGPDETTFTKKNTEEPRTFDLRLKSPSDGSTLEVIVYRCLCTGYRLIEGNANREFKISGFDFRAYGQTTAQGEKLFQVIRPGNTTGAS